MALSGGRSACVCESFFFEAPLSNPTELCAVVPSGLLAPQCRECLGRRWARVMCPSPRGSVLTVTEFLPTPMALTIMWSERSNPARSPVRTSAVSAQTPTTLVRIERSVSSPNFPSSELDPPGGGVVKNARGISACHPRHPMALRDPTSQPRGIKFRWDALPLSVSRRRFRHHHVKSLQHLL